MASVYDLHGCLRMGLGKLRHRQLKLRTAIPFEIPHPKRRRGASGHLRRLLAQAVQFFQQGAAFPVKVLPRRCQGEFPPAPVQQLHTQLLLQRLDLLGHGGLGDVAALAASVKPPDSTTARKNNLTGVAAYIPPPLFTGFLATVLCVVRRVPRSAYSLASKEIVNEIVASSQPFDNVW